jgi:hypothetical protein
MVGDKKGQSDVTPDQLVGESMYFYEYQQTRGLVGHKENCEKCQIKQGPNRIPPHLIQKLDLGSRMGHNTHLGFLRLLTFRFP